MRIDPAQVFANAILLPPVKFIFAWLIGALGCFAPLLIAIGPDAFRSIGIPIVIFPFYLIGVCLASGNYILISIPLVLLTLYKVIIYMINDNERSDLYIIFTAAYIATLAQAFEHPILACLPIPPLIYLTIRSIKSEAATSSL